MAAGGLSLIARAGDHVLPRSAENENKIWLWPERRSGQTPATRLGDGLPALAALLAGVAAVAVKPRRQELSV